MKQPEERIQRFQTFGFGLMMHWGLYSLLGKGEWFQFFDRTPREEYARLMDRFTADGFDAREIVAMAKKAGMRYIVLTTRHHEGFSLYDTRGLSDFDVMHTPAKRDLIKEFVDACHEEGISPFLYHTTLDWHQPSYEEDFPAYLEYLRRSVEILCTQYGEIGGFWFDGNWDRLDADWEEEKLYAIIRRHQPQAIIVNNPGWRFAGKLTHPEVDVACFEQGRPQRLDYSKMEKYVAGEMSQTLNDHWAYGTCDLSYKSIPEIIQTMCICRGAGANYLLNLTPDGSGKIPEIQKAMVELLGRWIEINQKPFYEGRPTDIKGSGDDFVVETPDDHLYLFAFDLHINGNENVTINMGGTGPRVYAGLHKHIKEIRWLDNGEKLKFFQDEETGSLCVNVTSFAYGYNLVVRVAEMIPAEES